MSDAELDTINRRIRSRCGGLIETIGGPFRSPEVRFMHQSVRDFVASLKFKNIFEWANDPMCFENGYSFMAKFGLALLYGKPSTCNSDLRSSSKIPWLNAALGELLFNLCAGAFHEAERTIGLSQGNLLDSVPDQQFLRFFSQSHYRDDGYGILVYSPRKWPIDSRLSFAVMTRMSIYLQSKFSVSGTLTSCGGLPLVHAIVEKINHDEDRVSGGYEAGMKDALQLLVDHGADVRAIYENITPLQQLFRWTDPRDESDTSIFSRLCPMVDLLLTDEIDANADIFYLYNNRADFLANLKDFISKPLHLSIRCPEMVELLLKRGANVNSLDAKGRTALDIAAISPHDDKPVESAAILIRNGGACTEQSLCIDPFSSSDDSDEEEFTNQQNQDNEDDEDDEDAASEDKEAGDVHMPETNRYIDSLTSELSWYYPCIWRELNLESIPIVSVSPKDFQKIPPPQELPRLNLSNPPLSNR
jgi:hypothetical protein